MARSIRLSTLYAIGTMFVSSGVYSQEAKPARLQPDGYEKPTAAAGGIQVSASASSSSFGFGAAQVNSGGGVSGVVRSNATASVSTDGNATPARPLRSGSKQGAADKPQNHQANKAVTSNETGDRRVTTLTRDPLIVVISQAPQRIAVIIIDDSGEKPRTRSFVAVNAEALQKKSPEAYRFYEEAQAALPQAAGAEVGVIGNPAVQLLEQLKLQQKALQDLQQ
jgi:hypothetical protein